MFDSIAGKVGVAALLSALSVVVSLGLAVVVAVRLPADYFVTSERSLPFPGRPHWQRVLARVGLNIVGWVLVLGGVIMALPGVPGQGFLTIFIGLLLVDIPGKVSIERSLVRRKFIQLGLNKLSTASRK